MSYSENDFAELVASINEINPILLSDLMLSVNLSLSDGIIEGIKKSLLNIMTSDVYHKRIRFTAGYWLAKLGDTRFDNNNFIIIPEKQGFQIGDASRSCLVDIKKFSVSKHLVTNQEFKLFKENRGYTNKAFWSDQGWQWVKSTKRSQPSFWEDERFNLPNCPVVGVSWFEADAYAKWKSARLLTEIEWEYLATYYEPTGQKRKFPWGDSYEDDRANVMMGNYLFEPSPVGMFPKGANHWGVNDLAGNVWEWCSSLYLPYPYDQSKTEKRNVLGWRCLRGGSWYFDKQAGALGYTRFFGDPLNGEGFNRGFRIAKDE
jgi:formylglycine-generating enzyme required for sulfatase activity